jgi:ferredoxin-NADP reductase
MIEKATYSIKLLSRRPLSRKSSEIDFTKPDHFDFEAGQRLRFILEEAARDYSMISAPADALISFCIREVSGGLLSPLLAAAKRGTRFQVSGPYGYFTFKSPRGKAVFVATGTGIAPFVSMARSGVSGFTLLHGVRQPSEFYYETLLREAAGRYVPCVSGRGYERSTVAGAFAGRVTDYLKDRLERDDYDFYLCGRSEMIRDATLLVDEHFPGSRVYAESFD